MNNEFLYLYSTTSMLSIGALRCTAHLLPLLHPLHFIINARNKCVTLTLIVINGSDDPRLFSDSSKLISNQERKYTKIRVIVGTCCLSPPSGITAVPHRHSLLAKLSVRDFEFFIIPRYLVKLCFTKLGIMIPNWASRVCMWGYSLIGFYF